MKYLSKLLFILSLGIALSGCSDTATTAESTGEKAETPTDEAAPKAAAGVAIADLQNFTLAASELGAGWQKAERIDEENLILESGFVDAKGRKQGSWMKWDGARSPSLVEHYVDGVLHGSRVEFDPVGRLRKYEHYSAGKLDGRYAEYRAAIPQITATYRNGELNGTYRAHTLQNGKVNRSIEYRNGQPDGPMRWYNDNEELIQERIYKNGELVE
jgi:hypothetical protein